MLNYESELKNFLLETIILNFLNKKELSGLEIITILKVKSDNYYNLNDTYIYNKIYSLQENNLIKSKLTKNTDYSIPKKTYFITDKGKEVLKTQIKIYNIFIDNTSKLLN